MARSLFCSLVVLVVATAACEPGCVTDTGPTLPTEKVSSDFVFEQHAFSFPNFGGMQYGSALDPDLLARMFGKDSVCNPDFTAECRLLPIAKEYRVAVNDSLRGGRCEGFAVLSGLAARGEVDLSPFGSSIARELVLEDNRPLGAELAYWFATQYLRDVVPETTQALLGVEAVAFLNEELRKPDHSMFRIGLARLDPDTGALAGGHAVLATYVAPADVEGQYVIGVYDNNLPDAEREILVDAAKNRWSYQASSNPDDEETLYEGSAENNNFLYLSPAEPRRGRHPCSFCSAKDEDSGKVLAQVFGSASAQLVAAHPDGGQVGEHEAGLLDEHEDAHAFPSFTTACVDCRDGSHMALPHDREGGTLVTLRQAVHAPTEDGFVEDISAAFFGHGFVATVTGADVRPGEQHTLFIAGHGFAATYTSLEPAAEDVADIALGAVVSAEEQVLIETTVSGSESVTVEIDPELGDPTLVIRGPRASATARVVLEVTIGAVTREFAVDLPVPLSGSATFRLLDSIDEGDVIVEIDSDGDDVVDDVLALPDVD